MYISRYSLPSILPVSLFWLFICRPFFSHDCYSIDFVILNNNKQRKIEKRGHQNKKKKKKKLAKKGAGARKRQRRVSYDRAHVAWVPNGPGPSHLAPGPVFTVPHDAHDHLPSFVLLLNLANWLHILLLLPLLQKQLLLKWTSLFCKLGKGSLSCCSCPLNNPFVTIKI